MEIRHTARKHGIHDQDILHALATSLRAIDLDDDRRLVIGFDRAGRALELVIAAPDRDEHAVIHAMPMRRSLQHYL